MLDPDIADRTRDAPIAAERQQRLAPQLVELTTEFVKLAGLKLSEEGWQPDHARAITAHALPVFTADMMNGGVAREVIGRAIHHGRCELLAEIFDGLLGKGMNQPTALLALVTLDRENAERAAAPMAKCPEVWIDAVVAAAVRGETNSDRIAEGLGAEWRGRVGTAHRPV